MSKKRTRKQKQNVKHQFLISWKPEAKNSPSKANVKRQSDTDKVQASTPTSGYDFADISGKSANLKRIKRNIYKSLILAGLILASEIVLYFVWNVN